jgi:hypothetical protein
MAIFSDSLGSKTRKCPHLFRRKLSPATQRRDIPDREVPECTAVDAPPRAEPNSVLLVLCGRGNGAGNLSEEQ